MQDILQLLRTEAPKQTIRDLVDSAADYEFVINLGRVFLGGGFKILLPGGYLWVDVYEDRCSGWVDEEWHETVSIDSQNLVHMHHRLREIYKVGMPKDTN